MATDPRGAWGQFGYWLDTPDWTNFSNEYYAGAQSTEGWAPGYYTDNSGTFDNFFERVVLGGLGAIGGGAAYAELGGAVGVETLAPEGGFLPESYVPTDIGRTSPIVPSIGRWATVEAARAVGLSAPLARLIGDKVMDDDWGFNDIEDAWGSAQEVIRDYGGQVPTIFQGGSGGAQVSEAGMMGGAAVASAALAARSLWSVLRAGGARFSTFIGQNGVKAKLADLWPAVRQYGPQAVAVALGIGMAELGQLLAQAPTRTRRRRGRGISAADIRRAKRVIRFNRRLSRELGTSSRRSYRSYRPRRRSYGY